MRFVIIYAYMAVLSLLFVYGAGSFEQLELNPIRWSEGARLACEFAYGGILFVNIILSILVYQETD